MLTITNNQNHNVIVIVIDYIERNHDYNRDYIRNKTFSEQKPAACAWLEVSIFSDNIRMNAVNEIANL